MKAEWTNTDSLTFGERTKAVLVIDMPQSCEDCPCYHEGYGHCNNVKFRFIQDSDKVAPWCPLKPMPEKKDIDDPSLTFDTVDKYIGFNECIEELEK